MVAIPLCFAVLETGYSSEYTKCKYGGYAKMLENMLKDPEEVWDIFQVIDGNFPSLEELDKYDGFVLTGSSSDAHGNEEWILKLCDILKYLFDNNKKTLGICFGHQVLSRALGGRTGRSSGWELGLKEIQLNTDQVQKLYGLKLPSVLKTIESHQDQMLPPRRSQHLRSPPPTTCLAGTISTQSAGRRRQLHKAARRKKVSCVPPNGVVLGYSAKTPIEIFAVGNSVLGIQGHPEFSEDVLSDLLNSRLARGTISEEVCKEAELSFKDNQPDQESLKNLCKSFLKRREGI